MALRLRLASVVMSQTSQRLSSSGVRNIGTPLANVHTKEQSRASTAAAPCFAWKEKKPLGITTPEELEKRISAVKKLANDANLCIQDYKEIDTSVEDEESRDELLADAKVAVEHTTIAFSELLEELAVTDEGVEVLNDVRKLYAPEVESLREELKRISTPKEEED